MSITTQHTHTLQSLITTSLIAYANENPTFARFFNTLINQNLDHTDDEVLIRAPSPFLLPNTIEDAEAQAIWLIREIVYHTNDKTTQTTLTAWARERQLPQDAVLGIVGVAIIGPTLGLIKKKKKRKSQMRIVYDQHYTAHASTADMVHTSHSASLGILSDALTLVHGDTTRLDPELADWTLADRDIALFTNTQEALRALQSTLSEEQLPHCTIKNDDTIVAIALHPAISHTLPCGVLLET